VKSFAWPVNAEVQPESCALGRPAAQMRSLLHRQEAGADKYAYEAAEIEQVRPARSAPQALPHGGEAAVPRAPDAAGASVGALPLA
jgi:hypothetical protein